MDSYTNNRFDTDEYRHRPIRAAEIARLLTAGLDKEPHEPRGTKREWPALSPFVIFTGGGNGCGKSTFIENGIERELRLRGFIMRNMDVFYATVCDLKEHHDMFADIPRRSSGSDAERGKAYWEALVALFPEMDRLRTSRFPLVDGDMVGALDNACIAHKLHDADFLIRDHYYRTLNNMATLCTELARSGHSFVVDTTMSNPDAITQAAKATASENYKVHYAIFRADNAVQRVVERGKRNGRTITEADAERSQQKMPRNFPEFLESAKALGGFIGLYDTSANNGRYALLLSQGEAPALTCLTPERVGRYARITDIPYAHDHPRVKHSGFSLHR
jgi:predicted ABC-type ATPase